MQRLAIIFLFFFVSFVFLPSVSSAQVGICSENYADAPRIDRSGLLSPNLTLTVAIRDRHGWYFPFTSTGCYDLSKYRNRIGKTVNLFINNKSKRQHRTYLSATMIKVDAQKSSQLNDGSNIEVTFRRNDADWRQLPASTWLHAREVDFVSIEGTVKTTTADKLFRAGGYEGPPFKIDTFPQALVEMGVASNPIALWHGLIVSPLNNIQKHAFVVEHDTVENYDATMSSTISNFAPNHSVTIRNDLIAFNQTESPSLENPIFSATRRSCIYFSYRVGGEREFPDSIQVMDGIPNLIVIRLDRSANC